MSNFKAVGLTADEAIKALVVGIGRNTRMIHDVMIGHQVSFPKSKKRRIRKKWKKQFRNYSAHHEFAKVLSEHSLTHE